MPYTKGWFEEVAPLGELFENLTGIVLMKIGAVLTGAFFASFFFTAESLGANSAALDVAFEGKFALFVFYAGVVAPLIEELIFRLIPFSFLALFLYMVGMERGRLRQVLTIVVLIGTSLLFGYVHGPGNVLIQGVGGFILGLVFLKWSALDPRWLLQGYLASMIVHGAFNGTVILIGEATKTWA